MNRNLLRMARRALGKPPAYVARRALQELQAEAERFLGPRRARRFGRRELLAATGAGSVAELWDRVAARPYVAVVEPMSRDAYETLCPGDSDRILRAAERALSHRVDLLGSGDIHLGDEIDWHKDYKSGFRWPPQYCRDIDYMNPGRPSDVKFPWELSRMQWVIPCGQSYLLTGDERWAQGARRLIEDWISANPYAGSVNWSCTMEAALRILSWTWLFHACAKSTSWADEGFRTKLLASLWMHAGFTDRHIELADVNGNHCDADAAALVFAGLFFGSQGEPARWLERGWRILCDELPKQVSNDGVDYEGSVPYHRLVAEFFFLPALFRQRCGLAVPAAYTERVVKMGWFTEAYTRPDGSAPVCGDADDARALPLGGQHINDHRYLLGWIGEAFGDSELARRFSGSPAECVWLLGRQVVSYLLARPRPTETPRSVLFQEGGYAVLRSSRDHVFIDCGPVGLAGRGGHGHNDVLSFEAVLDGQRLVSDCGAFVYTADFEKRNAFRSTAYHNTPRVDREEVNRFLSAADIWWLRNDATPLVEQFELGHERTILRLGHTGYMRLPDPVRVTRSFVLERAACALTIRDSFECTGEHEFEVPLHVDPHVDVVATGSEFTLSCNGVAFRLEITSSALWTSSLESGWISPSYGKALQTTRILWRRHGRSVDLQIRIERVDE